MPQPRPAAQLARGQKAALRGGADPGEIVEAVGDRGASARKSLVMETVNEWLRSCQRRRTELVASPGYLDDVLVEGNARANQIADETLHQVCRIMGMGNQLSR